MRLPDLPRIFWYARISFSAVSLASEPEFEKNTRRMPGGASPASRSARRIAGSLVLFMNDG